MDFIKRLSKKSKFGIKIILILIVILGFLKKYLAFEKSEYIQKSHFSKIMCIVLTSEKKITTRGVAVWDTWGKDCKTLFACNCKNVKKYNQLFTQNEIIPDNLKKYSIVANYPILYLDVDEDYNKMVKLIS
jgi:hypothetical protein